MDERLNKLLWLIEKLPADQIVIIAEKCKWFGEISPRVQKLISIFDKLSDEEKDQFFRNITPQLNGDKLPGTWDSEATAMTAVWSTRSSESDE